MEKQLIRKDCATGSYEGIYPVTSLQAVKDMISGKNLEEILKSFNHLYLPFKDNSRTETRLQVPNALRRKGLWVTYVSCKGNVVTEFYNSTDYSNKAWGDSNNWKPYLCPDKIKEALGELFTWYEA